MVDELNRSARRMLGDSGANMAPRTLWHVGWRYAIRHAWQSVLMVLGIALGVAVVVAVDLANVSASRAFDLSVDSVVGRATHHIVGGPQGLDETIYADLRRAGILRESAPIVTAYATSPQLAGRPVQLLGVDPFAEAPFRSYISAGETTSVSQLVSFLTEPGAVLISADVALRHELAPGAGLELEVAGRQRPVVITGLLEPTDDLSRRALEGLMLADIATAQELTGRVGRLDRIDLILPEPTEDTVTQLEALLSRSADGAAIVQIQPVATRTGATRQMTAAFRLNLTALSLLALVVGMFLIYNTMTFSVVQRRPLFGVLRSLGVTRREVFALVLGEALIIGVISAGLGLALGVVMGQSAVQMVTRTISDLYFVLTVRGVEIPLVSLLKGAVLGVGATLAAAVPPAREAAIVPPRAALSRSGLETKAERAAALAAIAGAAAILAGAATLALPTNSLIISFGGTFLIVLGFALLTPLVTKKTMDAMGPSLKRILGVLGRMAPRDVSKSLSRTAIAVAALMVAMSVTIGISLMITSFRQTVIVWLSDALQGDIVVSAPSVSGLQDVTPVDAQAASIVSQHPNVSRVDLLRSTTVGSPSGPIDIEAGNSPDYGDGLRYRSSDGSPREIWDAVHEGGAVIVSEPLSNRLGLSTSDTLSLYTEGGLRTFPVAGVYYDYASTRGTAIMSFSSYRAGWGDDTVTALVIQLEPGADPDQTARDLEQALAPVQGLLARPNQAIRQAALAIFDRTFAITSALQALATIVAFIGVLSALLALQLEKQREYGILRAVGLTTRELRSLILLETGLMGTVAGLLSMPAGLVLALVLIYVINRRSFGWTLQMVITAAPFAQAVVISLLASLLAGIYPALRMGRMAPAEALRHE
jgi:putative ABC transport system permease protein